MDDDPELINCVATAPPKKDEGQSLLQVANKAGNLEIAHYLIDKGIDVNYMEPDHGLSWPECYTCPVLIDAVDFLIDDYFDEGDIEGRMNLIRHLLEKGADPNKTNNRRMNAWDEVINTYTDAISSVDEDEKESYEALLKEVLEVLYPYVDILNMDRIDRDLKEYRRYSLFFKNLILNRDDLYGVEPEDIEVWEERFVPIIPIVKPFYMKNNPHYENDK